MGDPLSSKGLVSANPCCGIPCIMTRFELANLLVEPANNFAMLFPLLALATAKDAGRTLRAGIFPGQGPARVNLKPAGHFPLSALYPSALPQLLWR